MLKITLPDGSMREYDRSVCPMGVASEISTGLAKATLGAVIDGEIKGADTQLPENGEVALRLLTKKDPEALDIMRHSAAHLMARAVMRLYPGVQLAFGPTVENGFYYDLWTKTPLSEEDFPKIEAEMKALVKADEEFERIEFSKDKAIELCREMGQTLKVEHLSEGLGEQETVSFYRQGEFLDLCRGPHIPSPKSIGAFKLLSIAGAYWKGDASRQQLQRLYATAFFDKKELDDYLFQLEEAKKRDHRVLGKRHELFLIDPKVGQGLILWLPKGAVLRRQLENFIYDELIKRGYMPVNTPPIGKVELYETSGHYPYYADSQFPPIAMQDGERFLVRPMNCPHHVMIY
jgi:threonyl-tRNA synthetase